MWQVLEGPMLCDLVEVVHDCGVPSTVRVDAKNKKLEFNSLFGGGRKSY